MGDSTVTPPPLGQVPEESHISEKKGDRSKQNISRSSVPPPLTTPAQAGPGVAWKSSTTPITKVSKSFLLFKTKEPSVTPENLPKSLLSSDPQVRNFLLNKPQHVQADVIIEGLHSAISDLQSNKEVKPDQIKDVLSFAGNWAQALIKANPNAFDFENPSTTEEKFVKFIQLLEEIESTSTNKEMKNSIIETIVALKTAVPIELGLMIFQAKCQDINSLLNEAIKTLDMIAGNQSKQDLGEEFSKFENMVSQALQETLEHICEDLHAWKTDATREEQTKIETWISSILQQKPDPKNKDQVETYTRVLILKQMLNLGKIQHERSKNANELREIQQSTLQGLSKTKRKLQSTQATAKTTEKIRNRSATFASWQRATVGKAKKRSVTFIEKQKPKLESLQKKITTHIGATRQKVTEKAKPVGRVFKALGTRKAPPSTLSSPLDVISNIELQMNEKNLATAYEALPQIVFPDILEKFASGDEETVKAILNFIPKYLNNLSEDYEIYLKNNPEMIEQIIGEIRAQSDKHPTLKPLAENAIAPLQAIS